MRDSIIPHIKIRKSQGAINDQGFTYNESGKTYNETGMTYGGFYGFSEVVPTVSLAKREPISPSFAKLIKPSMTVKKSQGAIEDQGYTYNQAGLTYNEVGVYYGGFYGFADVQPLMSLARNLTPRITNFADIYTPLPPPPSNNLALGPGFFMFVTQ